MPKPKKYPNGWVMISVVLDPETKKELDIRRGYMPRGDFIKWLLEVTRDLEPPWAPQKKGKGEPHAETHSNGEPKGAGSH